MSKINLRIGTFVRMCDGTFGKIVECPDSLKHTEYENEIWMDSKICVEIVEKRLVSKTGSSTFDLIKPKDILLSYDGKIYQCSKIYKDYVFTTSKNKYGQIVTLVDYQIDKILPYELFSSYSYEIE